MASSSTQTFASRINNFPQNEAARALLETMERKQTNLCVSVDVTKKQDLLDVVKAVSSVVALVKTHIDIVEDFDQDLIEQLSRLSKEADFLIFEDRKFADIGNTVSLQYSSGVHKIASWSHITNAHLVPGPGIITGLAKVGKPRGRGLLLLAEMSSAGTLAKGDYSKACVDEALKDESGFVIGFIAQDRVHERLAESTISKGKKRDFLILTPGVGLDTKGDGMGQQYRTPEEVVLDNGCDVIIVGRGIYGALMDERVVKGGESAREKAFASVKEQGERYKKAGWQAYLKRTGAQKSAGRLDNGALRPLSISFKNSRCRPYEGEGVDIVFAYGSLIFKPPPHTIGRTVGYVKGYARRFAQSSNDHRGTPGRPGRVVTLVCASQWHSFISDDDTPEGDIVWGVAWTIDPTKSKEVRAYLDDREKNGYTAQSTQIYQRDAQGKEIVAIKNALIYVGLPDNEAFVGPARSLKELAEYIFTCQGPSGRNDEYVLKLAAACRSLSPNVADSHLFTLESFLLELRRRNNTKVGIINHEDRDDVHRVIKQASTITA